jgi:hypothetical protein
LTFVSQNFVRGDIFAGGAAVVRGVVNFRMIQVEGVDRGMYLEFYSFLRLVPVSDFGAFLIEYA